MFHILYFFQPLLIPSLQPFAGRPVVFPARQVIRQALHGRHFFPGVVGVLVALAIFQFLHQAGGRVADVQRHRKKVKEILHKACYRLRQGY